MQIKKQASEVQVGETIKFRVGLEFLTGKISKIEVSNNFFGLTVVSEVFGETLWYFADNFELDVVI